MSRIKYTLKSVIFVSGKYSGTFTEREDNIYEAEQASVKLLKMGWSVLTPHKNTSHYDKYEFLLGMDYQDWINCTISLLSRCDAIFMMKNYRNSIGAKLELDYAKDNNMLIFYEEDGYPETLKIIQD